MTSFHMDQECKRRKIFAQYRCNVHGLGLELFCTDDQKLVCLECVSNDHKEYNFVSIKKAAEEHRKRLQKPLQELESRLKTFTSKKTTFTFAVIKLQSQGQQTETQIKQEFKKLHQFLTDEEEAHLSALRDEQKKKTEKITEKIEEVDKLHNFLSEQIQNIKDALKRDDSLFLHNVKETEKRFNLTLPDPKLDSTTVIDVAKHMGNLRFRVWGKMKQLCPYYPVILNPNSTTVELAVSSDLASASCLGPALLNSPENRFCFILGSEGFSSGVHTWQVDLEACEHWALGVVNESAKRLQKTSDCLFLISCINGKRSWTSVASKIKKVCVLLDVDKHQLVFSDPDTKVILRSFTITTFNEKMYPCFFPLSHIPMKIIPSILRLVQSAMP